MIYKTKEYEKYRKNWSICNIFVIRDDIFINLDNPFYKGRNNRKLTIKCLVCDRIDFCNNIRWVRRYLWTGYDMKITPSPQFYPGCLGCGTPLKTKKILIQCYVCGKFKYLHKNIMCEECKLKNLHFFKV